MSRIYGGNYYNNLSCFLGGSRMVAVTVHHFFNSTLVEYYPPPTIINYLG